MIEGNKEEVMSTSTDNDIIDIEIKESPKKKFRINGDSSKILELNVSDINIVSRLQKGYDKLQKLMSEVANVDVDDIDNMSDALSKIDKAMREQLDYIFDSNVSEVCGKNGNMYEPYQGMFRYEHIIDGLTKLYTNNLNEEFKTIRKRIEKHTGKYTKKK